MFLDASRDSVVRMGYEVCASLMRQTSAPSSRCWELWYVLNTSGNACPLNGEEASRTVSALCRLHRADPVAVSAYRLAWECHRQMSLAEVDGAFL